MCLLLVCVSTPRLCVRMPARSHPSYRTITTRDNRGVHLRLAPPRPRHRALGGHSSHVTVSVTPKQLNAWPIARHLNVGVLNPRTAPSIPHHFRSHQTSADRWRNALHTAWATRTIVRWGGGHGRARAEPARPQRSPRCGGARRGIASLIGVLCSGSKLSQPPAGVASLCHLSTRPRPRLPGSAPLRAAPSPQRRKRRDTRHGRAVTQNQVGDVGVHAYAHLR